MSDEKSREAKQQRFRAFMTKMAEEAVDCGANLCHTLKDEKQVPRVFILVVTAPVLVEIYYQWFKADGLRLMQRCAEEAGSRAETN